MAKKKNKSKKKSNEINISSDNLYNIFKDERFKFISGLFIFSLSIYIFLAFFSFLFTWKTDQSKLDIDLLVLIQNADIAVENWAGKVGAMLAKTFIHDWFGISSFGVIFILLLLGFRFFNIRLLPFFKSLKYTIIIAIWLSLSLGFVFGEKYFSLGGAHGYFMSHWLNSFIGKLGTAIILLIYLFGILVFLFENLIQNIKNYLYKIMESRNSKMNKSEIIETKNSEANQNIIIDSNNEEGNIVIDDNDLGFEVESTKNTEDDLIDENAKNHNIENDNELNITENVSENDVDAFEINLQNNITTLEVKDQSDKQDVKSEENLSGNDLKLDVESVDDQDGEAAKKISKLPQGNYDPTKDLSNYKLPSISLLKKHDNNQASVSNEELIENKNRIVETLNNYKIKIEKIKATIGPTVTLYEIIPAPGVRISKIKNLEDDIALSLAALGIRIIAPMPGKGTIGIEVPNKKPEIVSMSTIIASKKFQETKYELPLALGKTISNETFVVDLAKMPHLLVAGATGQGKSVGLNAIITSLLYKKHPSQIKFVMVDPKKVELTLYSKIERHFLAKLPDSEEAIITDTQKVVNTLNSLTIEMDQRYDLLKKAHTRNIKEYNQKFINRRLNPENGHRFLPYIILVIDEFADLIMTAGKEIELPIARLAQLARAIGIHLIIATQRPTTNIITGLIKANFPARIAFRVTSSIDSRTILDSTGANQLIGRGDMLVSNGSDMVRVQCAFVDTPEIEEITEYIGSQQAYSNALLLPEYVDENKSIPGEVDLKKRDELFDDAARIIVLNQQGSTSLIQRKFSIGYNRAGRIIDQLEAAGVVGSFEGSKARKVLIPDEYSLDQLLNRLNNN